MWDQQLTEGVGQAKDYATSEGVEELDQKKLTPLLREVSRLTFRRPRDLGKPEEIDRVFAEFQKYLYQGGA